MQKLSKLAAAGTAAQWLPLAILPVLVACGGGKEDGSTTARTLAAPAERVQALAATTPAVGSLALVSSTATGLARPGDVCATSADGGLILFSSASDTVVSGDNNAGATDLFLKNLRTGAVTRVSTTSSGGPVFRDSSCLGMTPDGRNVALMTATGGSGPYQFPPSGAESAIFVKNLVTGAFTRVTPPIASLPNTAGYQFAGLSNDGLRVAFVALPTTTYLGGYETIANGPARLIVSDLSNPAAVRFIALDAQARLSLQQGAVVGDALLSPDGRQVAFSTQADITEVGDNNGKNDAFLLTVDTLALRQVNTDVSGTAITAPSPFGPSFGLQAFIGQGRRLVFNIGGDSSAGPAGLYAKNLDSGELRPLLATASLPISGNGIRLDISLSDAGAAAAFVRRTGNSQTGQNLATLRNLVTGQESSVATTAAGVASNGTTTTGVLISADGSTAAFANNGRNLVGTNRNFELRVYAKTVAVTSAAGASR